MTSRADGPSNDEPPDPPGPSGRTYTATVYDAVAGRISTSGFISELPFIAATRDLPSSSTVALPPEDVLFRRKNAPLRYEESDLYFASDSLPPRALPDSDLLKALHCYTSDFYSRSTADDTCADWQSMDDTALLALGILMEELCRKTLGDKGDMVFTEGEISTGPVDQKPSPMREEGVISVTEAASESSRTRRRKRRRLDHEG